MVVVVKVMDGLRVLWPLLLSVEAVPSLRWSFGSPDVALINVLAHMAAAASLALASSARDVGSAQTGGMKAFQCSRLSIR